MLSAEVRKSIITYQWPALVPLALVQCLFGSCFDASSSKTASTRRLLGWAVGDDVASSELELAAAVAPGGLDRGLGGGIQVVAPEAAKSGP